MQKLSKLVLLVVASVTFVVGICGAILFYPEDLMQVGHARGQEGELKWQTSLAAASNMAKQEHKYVLADIYTDWCGWCKKLDKDVFPKPKVVKYLQENFICAKVNAEDPREGQKVARAYRVDGFPCALVFSPDGKLIGRIPGYIAADGYVQTLQQITGNTGGGSDGGTSGNSGGEQAPDTSGNQGGAPGGTGGNGGSMGGGNNEGGQQ